MNESNNDAIATDEQVETFDHTAAYSPQDDKLRLFFGYRLPRDEWDALRAKGWTWTMKQDSDMVALWTPSREDDALALCGEIGDEDQPREERAADRAERFGDYRDKREGEAVALADQYDSTPRVHGHQDARRAERSRARHDRVAGRAVTQWDTAEYWQRRTAGVIFHALHLERADVRHRRIKGLEAELRKDDKQHAEALAMWAHWTRAAAMPEGKERAELVETLACYSHCYDFRHPTDAARAPTSLWSLLRPGREDVAPVTDAQAVALWFSRHSDPAQWRRRSANHLRMRIAYELQMLSAQGGTMADVIDMVAGGFVGKHQVQKVTKDRAGRVSKLYFLAPTSASYDRKGNAYSEENPAPLSLHAMSAEDMKPGAYRSPTDEELTAFRAGLKAASAAKPKAPPLINPTDADAERMQAAWNAESSGHGRVSNTKVARLTAEQYRNCAGSTEELHDDGFRAWDHERVVCRVRKVSRSGSFCSAYAVVIITDAPQKPAPCSWHVDPFRSLRRRLERCGTGSLWELAREAGMAGIPGRSHGEDVRLINEHLDARAAAGHQQTLTEVAQ